MMNGQSREQQGDGRKPKLLDQARNRIRLEHKSPSTEKQYVYWIRKFILFHNKRHPLQMGADEVTRFLTHLAVERDVAASTQNQALAALLYLYQKVLQTDFGWLENVVRASKPKRLPVVFSRDEVAALLGVLYGIRWTMACMMYGGGLRGIWRSLLAACARAQVSQGGAGVVLAVPVPGSQAVARSP